MSNLEDQGNGKFKGNGPIIGLAAPAALLEGLHCSKVVGGYITNCQCNSAIEVLSYAYGLEEVVVAGLLMHSIIFASLCAVTAMGVVSSIRDLFK